MTRDEVREFKNYLRNYPKQKKRVEQLKQKREQIYYRLTGVGAKPVESSGIHLDQNQKEMARLDKFEEIDNISAEIKMLEMMIKYVESYLDKMDEGLRHISIEVYCNGKSLDSFADDVGYTASGLARLINREIQNIINS